MKTRLEVAVVKYLEANPLLRGPTRELAAALEDPNRNAPATIHQPIYDPDHPLVHCPDCDEEYTACDLGNHYCPTCGESCESADEVACDGCPCTDSGGEPCCWCGQGLEAHTQRVP